MKLSLGFSPCPNDTFIFDAIVNRKIDTLGLEFDFCIADVEELNRKAFSGVLDCTKLSYHTIFKVLTDYIILNSGSALGLDNGPLLVSKKDLDVSRINDYRIAIPGENTTANLLFKIAFPEFNNKDEFIFSDISDAVLKDKVDAGLIIHETRFTFESLGLKKIMDFGEYWQELTNMPLPLGGIVAKRTLPKDVQNRLDKVISNSIKYALNNPNESVRYVKQHSQEVDDDVIQKHIKLYVNDYSINLGEKGKAAIAKLLEMSRIGEEGFVKELFLAQID